MENDVEWEKGGGGECNEAFLGGVSIYRLEYDNDNNSSSTHPSIHFSFCYLFPCSYSAHAYGHDELLPMSDHFVDNNGRIGLTLIDSLDTLWYMGLKEEFDKGVNWVIENLNLDSTDEVSIWEYGTKVLGGLLAAYELSGNELLLVKSVKVGDLIMDAIEDNALFPAVGKGVNYGMEEIDSIMLF